MISRSGGSVYERERRVGREGTRGEIGRERGMSGTGKAKGREWIEDLQGTEEGWMDWGRKSGDE
jgi:hypothetical protein